MKLPSAVYLDCNATTPIEPEVRDLVIHYMVEEFGNAGSRTHAYGARAKQAVERAREQIATVVKAKPDEVIFTSGATESNNLAILGLAAYGEKTGRKHIVSSAIEHKAVLEPLEELTRRGFELTLVPPRRDGWVEAAEVRSAVRQDTLLVSVMHVNNETGVVQPITEVAEALRDHGAYFHVDAAQGFGKELEALKHPRIDLISVSGHKIYAPKGIGALIMRRRGYDRVPLKPLMFGGGQERGLRPGTLPVHLIAGLGLAAELSMRDARKRAEACRTFREQLLAALTPFRVVIHGDPDRTLPHVVSLSFPDVDSEALMVAWKDLIAVSNGSACTSSSYQPSYVLQAMGLEDSIQNTVRISWSHNARLSDWRPVVEAMRRLGHGAPPVNNIVVRERAV